jgi:hypothetical protein
VNGATLALGAATGVVVLALLTGMLDDLAQAPAKFLGADDDVVRERALRPCRTRA